MIRKTLIYWRDIPSQIVAQRGRQREKRLLSRRFQVAIDRAAMRAGKGRSDAYLAEWRRVSSVCEVNADLPAFVEAEARRLEAEFPDALLAELVRRHGASVLPRDTRQV